RRRLDDHRRHPLARRPARASGADRLHASAHRRAGLPRREADSRVCPDGAGRRRRGGAVATTLDVFLALDDLPPDLADTDTADGRPATREHALARLNRMFCLDAETVDVSALVAFAHTLRERLVGHL